MNSSVTIVGPGAASLAVDGGGISRVFHLASNTVVSISGLKIAHGNGGGGGIDEIGGGIYSDHANLTISNCVVWENSAGFGAGICNNTAMLTVLSSMISSNVAYDGGGIANSGGTLIVSNSMLTGNLSEFAAAIYNDGEFGFANLRVINSSFSNNSALAGFSAAIGSGGAIENDGQNGNALASISGCTFWGNSAGNGGSIDNFAVGGQAQVAITNSTFSTNLATNLGGAIHNYGYAGQATMIMVNTKLSENHAVNGGAIYTGDASAQLLDSTVNQNSALLGGGIYNGILGASTSVLTIANCAISENQAVATGGGIYNDRSMLLITHCSLTTNQAGTTYPDAGGGICNSGGSLDIRNSALLENSADLGGGIANVSSGGTNTVMIANSYLSANKSYRYGGGIYNGQDAGLSMADSTLEGNIAYDFVGFTFPVGGGGIFNGQTGSLRVVRCTLNGNIATGTYGAGVMNEGDALIYNSTLSSNYAGHGGGLFNAGNATVLNSTLSSNSALIFGNAIEQSGAGLQIGSTILNGAGGNLYSSPGSAISSLGYNLSSDNGGRFLTQPTDLVNIDPMLGPLQDNGGPTFTHALLCGSPAIDAGKNLGGLATDQRGFPRSIDDLFVSNATGGTDIGAFELQQGDCGGLAEKISLLIAQIQSSNLPSGIANSLTVKLQAAADALAKGNTSAGCGSLGAFMNEVAAQATKKVLVGQSAQWSAAAAKIRAALNCE